MSSDFDPQKKLLDTYARQPWDRVGSHERPDLLADAAKNSPIATNIGMGNAREEYERNGEILDINPIIGGKPGKFGGQFIQAGGAFNDMSSASFTDDVWFNPADHTKPFPPMLEDWQWTHNLWATCSYAGSLGFLVALSGTMQGGTGTIQVDLLDATGALVLDTGGNPLVPPQVSISFTCDVSPNPALFAFSVTVNTVTYGSGTFKAFNAVRFTGTSDSSNIGLLGGFVQSTVWYPFGSIVVDRRS